MPDAEGRFRPITVPRVPWHDEDVADEAQAPGFKSGGIVSATGPLLLDGCVIRPTSGPGWPD